MKRITIGVLIGILFLIACGQVSAEAVTVVAATQNVTATQSPTVTQTSLPTATPTASTPALAPGASVTPLPTIPTFTPTFDVSTIVTVTPAPKAECPQPGNPSPVDFATYPAGQKYVGHTTIAAILDFLNSGGQFDQLSTEFRQIGALYETQDVTNDGILDLIVVSGGPFQIINILWCQNGQYASFPKNDIEGETLGSTAVEFDLQDLNQNGLLEVISIGSGGTGFGVGINVNVLEWQNETFVDLTLSATRSNAWIEGGSKDDFELIDLDGNGIPEMELKGLPNSWYSPGAPLRKQIDLYSWNGKTYSPVTAFSTPQYRFQAVQDGDLQAYQAKHTEALKLYQDAIDSDKLDWWSKERFEDNREAAMNFTTPSVLTPDSTEYSRLAAYAYYRIMLLRLVQGRESEANTAYETLQEKFGSDQFGHPYVEMATAFWEAYQSTHKMYDGCAAAIQYAAEHPEILIPLGSDYHGWQSHIYVPADVCPFR